MIAASFFERVRQELLRIYEGLDTKDDVKRLKKECADWKRLAEEREDAHTQGYREGRAVANIRLDELKEELKAWKTRALLPDRADVTQAQDKQSDEG